jgi:redox-sensitive bicupin YhaK (pirin superfamily)
LACVFAGQGLTGRERQPAREDRMVVLAGDGDAAPLVGPPPAPLEVLLMAGVPLKEPVVR